MTTVVKFGGTSQKNREAIDHAIEIIREDPSNKRVIVVSAPSGVTNLLKAAAAARYDDGRVDSESLAKAKAMYAGIRDAYSLDVNIDERFMPIEELIHNGPSNHDGRSSYLAHVMHYGEAIQAPLFAEVLTNQGLTSRATLPEEMNMFVSSSYENAKLLRSGHANIAKRLRRELDQTPDIIIVPGFYGITRARKIATFSRGGSDITGAILTEAIGAELYENCSDANGMLRADPRIVTNPESIPHLTYTEAREFAYSGAKILHPDTVHPVETAGIPLRVRSTFQRELQGTLITTTRDSTGTVEGITAKQGFAAFNAHLTGMNETRGYLARLTRAVERQGLSIEQIMTGVDAVSLLIQYNGELERTRPLLETLKEEALDQGLADRASLEFNKAVVCVVGQGMKSTVGTLQRISRAIAERGVNIERVSEAAEHNLILTVDASAKDETVRAIYDEYFPRAA